MTMSRMKTWLLPLLLAAVVWWRPSAGEAANAYYRCEVLMAGPTSESQTAIKLRGVFPSFRDRWFFADPARAKEQLAVALAAMLHNKEVYVLVDLDLPGWPPVLSIILIN